MDLPCKRFLRSWFLCSPVSHLMFGAGTRSTGQEAEISPLLPVLQASCTGGGGRIASHAAESPIAVQLVLGLD